MEVTFPGPEIPPLAGYTYPLYQLDLTLKPETGLVEGSCILEYTNNEGEALAELYFHLYPNAPLFSEGSQKKGFLTVDEVLLNKGAVTWKQEGTLLQIKLPEPLPPGRGQSWSLPLKYRSLPWGSALESGRAS